MIPSRANPVPLSQTQAGIYISTVQSDQPTIYHLPHLHFMTGVDDPERLAEAMRTIVRAYPVLSATIISNAEGMPVMYADQDSLVEVETAEMTEEQLHSSYDSLVRPFDFESGRISRFIVIHTEKGVYLFTDIHHVIYDGLSHKAFMEQLDRAYRGLPLEEEPLSAFDVAAREAELRESPELEAQHKTFAALLEGCNPAFDLMPDMNGESESFDTLTMKPGIEADEYRKWCAAHGFPQSIPATAAAGIALSRFYRRDDLTLATIFHGRERIHGNTVSMMVRTLPVRITLTPGESIGSLLEGLKRQQKCFRENGLYSFADAARDFGVNSDFIFAYQGELMASAYVNGKEVVLTQLPMVSTGEKISAEMFIDGHEAELHFSYRSDLFSRGLIMALADAISEILRAMMKADMSASVDSLPTLAPQQRDEVLEKSCGGPSLADPAATVPALVAASARRNPDKTAIVFSDRSLTYGELDRVTDALARYLRDTAGVRPGDFVGIMIERSELMAIYPLAVMKAGAAYMPLDPHFPQERLEFMVEDAGLRLILDEDALVAGKLPAFKGSVVSSGVISTLGSDAEPICLCTPDSPMVVLYTSGSTGKPKGVVLRQRNVVNFCATYISLISLCESDRTGAYATFGFDAHIMDLYPALQAGATVHIFDPEVRLDLTAMHDYIEREKLTVLFMTTQIAWQMATLFDLPSVRVFSGGGEKLPPLGPLPYRFLNLYGPTECSVIATAYELEGATDGRIIGRPIPGYEVRILDRRLEPVPAGVPGELVIMGPGVASGYLNRDDLTAEKFMTIDGRPAYRTGDLARYLANGQIEFLGRMDGMVKLRGLRIELGEIEAVASRHPAVKSFVAAVKEIGGMENLAGYYVVREGCELDAEQLKAFISEELTEFMIPSVVIPLESMPLTPNGKVDRKALPVPAVAPSEIVAPSSEMERKILDIAADVLSHDSFGVTSNLVSEGLTSLMAMRLVAAVMKATGLRITAKEVMSAPTVAEIAARLERGASAGEARPEKAPRQRRKYYPLTENQRGVYIDWEMNRDALQYNIPQAFRLPDGTDVERLRQALEAVIEAHPGLKTRMVIRGADVMQQRDDEATVEVKVTRLDSRPGSDFFQERVRPFNLLEEPLIRCEIFTYGDEVYLMRDTHHIIFDGVSAMVFADDLMKAYSGQTLEKEGYGALDHALDEADLLESEAVDKAQEWFAILVADSEPTSYPRSAVPDNDIAGGMGRLSLRMPAGDIRSFCSRGALTASNYFLSAMLQLLHRLTREKTIQITTVNNGRSDMRLLPTTGMYVKTLPVVSRCDRPAASPLEFARDIQQQFLTTQDYDFYPFTSLVEKFGVRPEIMYVYEGGISLNGDDTTPLRLEPIELKLDTAKVPLTLLVFEPDASEYELTLEYDTSVYSRKDMELLLRMMRTLSVSLADAPTVADGVMTDDAQEAQLAKIRDGRTGSVPYTSFPGAMEARAKAAPDAPAVIACDRSLTYREFDEECNRVANCLIAKGVRPGDRVVGLLPRRSFLISAIYGIMKAGAAYIPCDPEYPADRIRLITEDSGARFIITTPDRMELYPGKALDVSEVTAHADNSRPEVEILPDSIAYMIYTSGSTGRPKGVMIPHRCIANYLYGYYTEFYEPHPEIRVNMLIVTISFDASLVDLGTSLTSGHALVLANEEECKDVTLLSQLMLRHKVDAFDITPSRLDAMLELPDFAKAVSEAKLLNIGGEGFKTSLINKLFATGFNGLAVNEYGPTECTVGSNHNLLYPDRPISAGPAFYNESERIIDAWGGELPVGAVGELYIFGAGVGAGYNNLPDKTAEAFVDWHGMRGYRTGDLARWDDTGDVTILGRIDHQVKLRGLRIELGEIENVALGYPGLKMAAADVREVSNIQHLCLYYTAEGEIDTEKLRTHLAASLTEYMVPDAYTMVEAMPLTPNGKINRKALPEPRIADVEPYVEPEGEIEKTVADAFARILNRERVGANDNFFAIGGTSINAIKVVAALSAAGHPVSYKNVFEARTPRQIAALIQGKGTETAPQAHGDGNPADKPELEFADVLGANNLRTFLDGESQSLGNVLLTGATGFMGIHMLHELVTTTDSKIYCTLRRTGDISAESRLRTMLFYYFDDTFDTQFAEGRICVIEADVTDPVPSCLEGGKIDTVINCAANVKHFSAGDDIEKVNVESVRNLADFCLRENARIVHISTVSVAGESVDGCPDPGILLTENMLDFGQNLSNQYVHSKYNAEHLLLTAVRDKGLNAKIMRVGNLSARGSDGEFQINFRSNAFMGRIKAYAAIGCVPFEALDAPCEFSPIDEVCRAILMLAGTARGLTVFQPCNNHRLPLGDVLHIVDRLGFGIVPVEEEEYRRRLTEAMEDPAKVRSLQPLLAYDSDSLTTSYIGYDSTFTNQLLYRLGFRWNYTSREYVVQFLKAIAALNYFAL